MTIQVPSDSSSLSAAETAAGAWIALAGVDGAGKSRQADLLTKRLTEEGYCAFHCQSRELFAWRTMRSIAYSRGLADWRDFFGNESTDFALVFDDLRDQTRLFIPFRNQGCVIVQPRSPFGRLALAAVHGNQNTDQLESILLFAGRPDITVWLDLPTNLALERIALRGTDSEDPGFLSRYHAAHVELAERYEWSRVDASMSADEVHQAIWGIFSAWPGRIHRRFSRRATPEANAMTSDI